MTSKMTNFHPFYFRFLVFNSGHNTIQCKYFSRLLLTTNFVTKFAFSLNRPLIGWRQKSLHVMRIQMPHTIIVRIYGHWVLRHLKWPNLNRHSVICIQCVHSSSSLVIHRRVSSQRNGRKSFMALLTQF